MYDGRVFIALLYQITENNSTDQQLSTWDITHHKRRSVRVKTKNSKCFNVVFGHNEMGYKLFPISAVGCMLTGSFLLCI